MDKPDSAIKKLKAGNRPVDDDLQYNNIPYSYNNEDSNLGASNNSIPIHSTSTPNQKKRPLEDPTPRVEGEEDEDTSDIDLDLAKELMELDGGDEVVEPKSEPILQRSTSSTPPHRDNIRDSHGSTRDLRDSRDSYREKNNNRESYNNNNRDIRDYSRESNNNNRDIRGYSRESNNNNNRDYSRESNNNNRDYSRESNYNNNRDVRDHGRESNNRDVRDHSRENNNNNRDVRDHSRESNGDVRDHSRESNNRDYRDHSRESNRDVRDHSRENNNNNRDYRDHSRENNNRESHSRNTRDGRTTTTTTTTTTSSSFSNGGSYRSVKDENATDLATSLISTNNFPKVQLFVNQFITTFGSGTILQHNVDFDPKVENRAQRNKLIQKLNIPFVHKYDGSSILYSLQPIMELHNIESIAITITKVAEYSNTSKQATQFFNILVKKIIRDLKFVQIGRQYYDPKSRVIVPRSTIEVWSGFFTSVGHTQAGTSLLCDVSHKIVRTTSVLDRITQMHQNRAKPQQIDSELQGNIVITKYNNKTYRIARVAWEKNITQSIAKDKEKSFKDYYHETYPKFPIFNERQPLLEVHVKRFGTTETIYLIPELCFATGIDDDTSKNFNLMKAIAETKHKESRDRFNSITNFIHSIRTNRVISEEMHKWSFSIQEPTTVTGSVIPKPERDMKKFLLKQVAWSVLVKPEDRTRVNQLISLLTKSHSIPPPDIYELHGDRFNLTNEISSKLKALKSQRQDFVMIVLQNPNLYAVVKQESLVKYGIVTQCIKSKTLDNRSLHSVAEKLVHQITAKVGKAPWVLTGKLSCPANTMVIGIDVGHNQDQKGKSVIGFVASLDQEFSLYHSVPSVQTVAGKEIISSLKPAVKSSLSAYHARNRCLPSTVVIYRDGVGDGMLQQVRSYEVTCVKDAFKDMAEQYRCPIPRLVYTIVKKNTNTRFVSRDHFENPSPGTVIDSRCTHEDWYDFFLISQKPLRGSVNPTHYHVIYDDAKMTAADFQMFTYYLTFLYFNYDSSVSVPAPTQFAHKLAFLIGRSVYQNINEDVAGKLYFL